MAKFSAVQRTVAKVVQFGLTLPDGIGLLTDGSLPVFPIMGPDDQVSHWLIYLQKRGVGDRPSLAQIETTKPIAELGNGWRLAKLQVADAEIHLIHKVIKNLEQLVEQLNERDSATEN